MKKNIKTKSVAWLQLPTNLYADERMEKLIKTEGSAGLGVYVLILTELYRRHSHQMTRRDVLDLEQRGFTIMRIKRVLHDYGLFHIDDYDHVTSAIDCCNITELINPKEADEQLTEEEQAESEKKTGRNQKEIAFPSPARITETQTQSSSSYRRRNNASEDATADNTVDKTVSAKPSPVLSVDEIISQMHQPSAWSEAIIMNSGFSRLLLSQWDRALQWFRLHITERSKEGDLPTLDHARRYFADLIHHPTTAALLQTYLKEAEQNDNPYHFEDPGSKPGHRSYLGGCTIPDDAPPRPNNRAEWVINRWETF